MTEEATRKHRQRYPSGGAYPSRTWARRRRRSLAIFFAVVALVGTAIGAALFHLSETEPPPMAAVAAPADAGRKPVERTAALPPLHLPADDAPHGSAMEWWYYNGILAAQDGQRFALHMVVFVANGLIKHTVMHVALTDLQSGKRYASQTRTAGAPANGVVNGFDFRQAGWQVSASAATHTLRAALAGASIALDLAESGPAIAHRAPDSETPGLLDFGSSGISYYYSRPRLSTEGSIVIGGKPLQVRGEVWFDHQWGEFDVLTLGWNWFALHLADGSDLMVYELFDMNGRSVMTAGTISNAKGSVPLKAGEIELTPGARWISPRTGITYAVEWKLKVPAGTLHIKPFLPDHEFDSSSTTGNVYWEGPVKVTGPLEGQGFLELSGYDRMVARQSKGR